MINRVLDLCLGFFCLLISANSLNAQSLGSFSGTVTDSETSVGLANANVFFPDLDLGTATDNSGKFRVTGLPEGSHRFEVTSIGYDKKVNTVEVSGDDTEIRISLTVVPYPLDGVEVQGLMTSRLSTEKVAVITSNDIDEQEAHSLSELLASVPGVDVQSAYSLGRNVNVSIRGSSDYKPGGYNNRVLLLLDGFPILIPNSGAADWNAVPINDIQRIEVVHGPASALYGQNSMGGVINLITHSSESNRPPYVAFSIGNYGANRVAASGGFSMGPFRATGNVSMISTDGHRFNANADLTRFSGKLTRSWSRGNVLSISGIMTESVTGHPGFVVPDQPSLVSYRMSRRTSRYIQIHHRTERSERISWSNSLAVHSFLTNYTDRDDTPLGAGESDSRYDDLSVAVRSELFSMLSPSLTIMAGIEGGFDRSDVTVMNPIYGALLQQTVAPFVQARKSLGGGWSLVSGLRVDYRRVDPGNDFTPREFKAFSPKLSLSYREPSRKLFHLSVNKGFRAPSLSELYLLHASSYGLFLQGTPSLRPENVWALETGYKHEYSEKLFWKTQVFYNRYSDMIDFVYAVPVKALNWQSVSATGAEFQSGATVSESIQIVIDYSFLKMQDLSGNGPLLYRPAHKINGTGSFRHGRFLLSVTGRYVSRQEYEDFLSHDYTFLGNRVIFPLKWLSARFLTAANLSYRFRSLEVSLKVDNLFDTDYQLIQNYPMPGRTWMLTFSTNSKTKGE
ncbi:MAG: TonB-dependent receptor [Candidatus Neomarinimicrobiota bacterium]|nr:TonB-dependent receptor [Candidatus Neomarinimicrobiota bacterium]